MSKLEALDCDSPPSASRWAAYAAVSAVCGLRVLLLLISHDRLQADPDAYRQVARHVVQNGQFARTGSKGEAISTAWRPPLYPLLLAAVGPDNLRGVAGLHALVGVATICLTYYWAKRLGLRWPSVPAICVGVDPILLNQSTLAMTETLATLNAVLALVATTSAIRQPSVRQASLAGAAWGLATLCRPTFFAAFLLVLLLAGITRRARRSIPVWLVAFSLVMTPWVLRNQFLFGRPVLLTTHGGYTVLLGNNPIYYQRLREKTLRQYSSLELQKWLESQGQSMAIASPRDELQVDRDYQAIARESMAAEPAWFARACWAKVVTLWRWMPRQGSSTARALVGVFYALESVLMIAGLWAAGSICLRRKGVRSVDLGATSTQLISAGLLPGGCLMLAFTGVHSVYWSDMRMRAPLVPVIAIWACVGIEFVYRGLRTRARPSAAEQAN